MSERQPRNRGCWELLLAPLIVAVVAAIIQIAPDIFDRIIEVQLNHTAQAQTSVASRQPPNPTPMQASPTVHRAPTDAPATNTPLPTATWTTFVLPTHTPLPPPTNTNTIFFPTYNPFQTPIPCGGAGSFTSPFSDNCMSAFISDVSVVHNIQQMGVYGMTIYVDFTIVGAQGMTGRAVAYFFDVQGNALRDFNGYYQATDGSVAVSTPFTPGYYSTEYTDLMIFVPYNELHMVTGNHALQFYVELWVNDRSIASSNYVWFNLTQN